MNLENNNPESEIQNDFDKQRLIDLSFFSEVLVVRFTNKGAEFSK